MVTGMPVPGTRPGMPEILLARARPKLDLKFGHARARLMPELLPAGMPSGKI